jgi:GTP-binding protein
MTQDPRTPEAEAIRLGRWLFTQECAFLRGVTSLAGLPPMDLPEVAFAGRSNVGKSSLVNALTGRKSLARTSNTPGRTREINFFDLGGRIALVDLPGYGYAQVSRTQVTAWTRLVRDYLRGRANLRRLMLLVDARHGLKPGDLDMMAELDRTAVSYQVVLTKADKVPKSGLGALLEALARELASHPAAHPGIEVTSARDGAGIDALRAAVAALAAPRSFG